MQSALDAARTERRAFIEHNGDGLIEEAAPEADAARQRLAAALDMGLAA